MPGGLAEGEADRRPVCRPEGQARSVVLAVRKGIRPVYWLSLNESSGTGREAEWPAAEVRTGGLANGAGLGRRSYTALEE